MCDNHKHAKIETWVTPENSQHLSSKMVHLFPGQSMATHTTGPDREEVIVVIYGTIVVPIESQPHIVSSGEALYIPANSRHAVALATDCDGALYCYVVTKKHPEHVYRN